MSTKPLKVSIPFPSPSGGVSAKLVELDTGQRLVRIFGTCFDFDFFEAVEQSRVGAVFTVTAHDGGTVTFDHKNPALPAVALPPPDLLMAEPQHEPLPSAPEDRHE